jgi:hypothetical protein
MHKNKTIWLLVAMKEDRLLLKKNFHEGKDVLQLPGGPSQEVLEELVSEIFGAEYVGQMKDFGVIHNVVIKSEETVDLHINLRRIVLVNTNDTSIPDDFEWCSKEQLEFDPRGARDARLHSRVFDNRTVALKFTEEQLDGWHKAKIISWDEDAV